jgi:hypothetical protein
MEIVPKPSDVDASMYNDPEIAGISTDAPALDSEACMTDGARACSASERDRPLVCQQGVWVAQSACDAAKRCDNSTGPARGTCQPLAAECKTRKPGDLFCDADGVMRACTEQLTAQVRPCGENERCVDVDRVTCACSPGFTSRDQACIKALDCVDRGGCDPLTDCQPAQNGRSCTMCPVGYTGRGETGCEPLLQALSVMPGPLTPPFSPEITQYHLALPLQVARITLTASAVAAEAALSVNDEVIKGNTPWMSPVLPLGTTTLRVGATARSGVRRNYEIVVERKTGPQTYLKASNGRAEDMFGMAVAAYGNTVVIGAPFEAGSSADPSGPANTSNAGAVYVFALEGEHWVQQAYLKSSQIATDDLFGAAVSIWEDRIAVGAVGHDLFTALGTGTRDGSVQVFARSGNTWTLQERIMPKEAAQSGNAFGLQLVLYKDSLIVGAPLEDDGALRSGAAYTFQWNGTNWIEMQRLKADDPVRESRYGSSLAFDGTTLAIGASQEDIGGVSRVGAAYVYSRQADGKWGAVQRFVAPTTRSLAQFGFGLAVQGSTLAISAAHNPLEVNATHAGEVHLYKRTGSQFTPSGTLQAPTPRVGDYFGQSLAMSATSLFVSAHGDPGALGDPMSNANPNSGAAYLYALGDGSPVLTAYIKANNAEARDIFGWSVALTDTLMVVGAPHEAGGGRTIDQFANDNTRTDCGAAYISR